MKRKVFSVLLALTMAMGTIPAGTMNVLAEEAEAFEEGILPEKDVPAEVIADDFTEAPAEVFTDDLAEDPAEVFTDDFAEDEEELFEEELPEEELDAFDEVTFEEQEEAADDADDPEWCQITFHANGGHFSYYDYVTEEMVTSDTYVETHVKDDYLRLEDMNVPDPLIDEEGMLFAGWALDEGGTQCLESLAVYDDEEELLYYDVEVTEDLNLYAVWEEGIIITFMPKEGDEDAYVMVWNDEERIYEKKSGYSMTVEADEYFTPEYLFEKEGCVQDGWVDEKEITYGKWDDIEPHEGMILYPTFGDEIVITFNMNGGSYYDDEKDEWVAEFKESYAPGDLIWGDLNYETAKDGYKIIGWNWDRNATNVILPFDEDEDMTATADMNGRTLFAIWKKAVKLTFKYNGGYGEEDEGVTEETREVPEGIPYMAWFGYLEHPDGLALSGWKDGSGKIYPSDGGEVTISNPVSGMVLTAQWTGAVTVTYHANLDGALIDENDMPTYTKKYAKDVPFTPSIWAEYDGDDDKHYNFLGWSLNSDGSGTVYDPYDENVRLTLSKDTDLYAVWEPVFIITLDANGGHFMWTDEDDEYATRSYGQYSVGESVYLSHHLEHDEERYAMLGWSEDPHAEKPEYSTSDVITPSRDMNLFAVWDSNAHLITWHAQGGILLKSYVGETGDLFTTAAADGQTLNDVLNVSASIDDDKKAFIDWSRTEDGSSWFDHNTPITEDMDLYAVWGEAAWITFNANGGIVKFSENEEVVRVKYVKNSYIHDRYKFCIKDHNLSDKFLGWTTRKNDKSTMIKMDGSTGNIDSMFFVSGDVTLYAYWSSYDAALQKQQKEKEAVARKAAAQKAFSLNVANNGSVPLQVKKTSKKVEVRTIAAGDRLQSAVSDKTAFVTASVSGNSVVLKGGKKTGTAWITVTTKDGAVWKFKVKVQKKKVKLKSIKVAKKKLTLNLKTNKTFNLAGVTNPLTAAEKVKYKSSDKKIAAVSSKGILTARKKGKAEITVSAGKKKIKVKVTVK